MQKVVLSFVLFLQFLYSLELMASDSPNLRIKGQVFYPEVYGNNQFTRAGEEFKAPLRIRLADHANTPLAGQELVVLKVLADKTGERRLSTQDTIRTDTLGIATYCLPVDLPPADYILMISPVENTFSTPLIINFHIRKRNWLFFLIIGLLGGLGLFLLGMNMMSAGMQSSAGNRMRDILSKLTHNRLIALSLGALVTMVIQSSSATNVMLVSFVNSKLMRFKQTIGIMLGAAVGTTITAQIIAFKLTDYSLLFIAIGLFIQYTGPRQSAKDIGKAVLGFGVLFFGMHIMSESMYPLRTYEPFLEAITNMQNPALGILVGAVFTALIQSSSAFIGILIILSMQGLLSLDAAIPLLIGANVGTSITAILASINGSRESKQVALAHTVFKIIGAALALVFLAAFTQIVIKIGDPGGMTESAAGNLLAQPRQIANAHTIYNIVLCLIFIPITGYFAKLITWIFPSHEVPEGPIMVRYIDESLLKAPVMALETARLELVRMMKKVYFMVEKIIHPFIDHNTNKLPEIVHAEEEINFLRDQLVNYLLKVTQNTGAADTTEDAFILMNAVREFEQIADVVSHQLKEKAESWCKSKYQFSEEGIAELKSYHEHTLTIIVQSLKVYENYNLKAARKVKDLYKRYRQEFFEMEKQHYDRLKDRVETSQSSSKTHLEIITLLRVISSHATNTSRVLLYKTSNKEKSKKNK